MLRQLHQGTVGQQQRENCLLYSSLQSPSHLESISSVSSGSINFFSSSFPLLSFVPLLLIFGAQLICLSFLSTRSFHQRSLQLHFIITLLLPPPLTKNKNKTKTNGHFTPRDTSFYLPPPSFDRAQTESWLASDRVLPVHFGLLSLVLFIRGASFVCPALAFELRVLDLAFLVSRPPALHNQYTAGTVRTERGLSLPGRITVFQCNSIPGYFSTGTRYQANSDSSHRGRSH